MSELKYAMGYLLKKYPHKSELSKARVTKMIYLADWRHVLRNGRQITDIKWVFHNHGPYVDDVIDCASQNSDLFKIHNEKNLYGAPKSRLEFVGDLPAESIEKSEKNAIEHIIKVTNELYWKGFIDLVYSTYPIVTSDRYTELDLVKLAKECGESEN